MDEFRLRSGTVRPVDWSRQFSTAMAALLLAAFTLLLIPTAAQAAASHGSVGTVYVTDLNLNSVTAIDVATHKITQIKESNPGLNGPLGIAISPDGRTAYVTNSLGDSITPINLATNPPTPEAHIKVGNGPAAIAVSSSGDVAYVSNFNANTVTPVNLRTSPPSAEAPIPVGSGPWSVAVSPNGRVVCVSNSEANTVSVINVASRSVTTIQVGTNPQAIAISPNGKTAFVASGSTLARINLTTSPPSAGSPIALANGPLGVAISPDGTTAYTANVDNTVTRIDLQTSPPSVQSSVPVASLTQPDGITIAPNGKTAFIANASNSVTPINLTTNPPTAGTPIAVGSATFGIAVAPGQAPIARLHVTTAQAGKATHFDASQSRLPGGSIIRYRWKFGDGAVATTRSPRTSHVYAQSGAYDATVTETGSDGTSTATTFTGQTVSNNGSPLATASLSLRILSALSTNPSSGPPGIAIALRDDTFLNSCAPVYIFFDNKLSAQATPSHNIVSDKRLVIPGDAAPGRHHIELSCSTSHKWLLSARFDVIATPNHLSEFSVAVPTFLELRGHLASAGGLSIALLLISRLIGAGFPSEWLDSTYRENRERIQARARKRFPKMFINRENTRSNARRFMGGFTIFLTFLGFAGLINSFLDPGFGLNRTTLWLFLGQCVGVGIVTLASQLPILFGGVREHRRVHLQVLVGGMVIAIICVSASRALGLAPGYCYGLIAIFMLSPHVAEKEWGKLHAIAALCILVVSTAAFFLTAPVYHAATSASPSPIWLILDPALNVVFLGGFASLAFGMFPLPFLAGSHVRAWNQTAWIAITGVGLIGFVAVLLGPGSGSSAELHHVALIPLLVTFAAFALISLAFMMYFHLRPHHPEGSQPHVAEASAD